MGTFADRVNELIGGKRRRNAFARECGLSETSVRQYQDGAIPGLDKVLQIARAKKVHVEWLATGEGPRDIEPAGALSLPRTQQEQRSGGLEQVQRADELPADMVLLPRLNIEASAGRGIVPADGEIDEFLAFKADFLRQLGVDPRNAHVLRIKGNSMYPTIRDRDVIIVDAALIEILEEGIYTLVYDGAVFAKRLQPLRDGSVIISSDNKEEGWRDETVPPSERHTLKIVGRVKGLYRNF